MKKMNFTIPNFAQNWLVLLAVLLATFNFTQANAQTSCVLAAADEVEVSLNAECKALLNVDMFLKKGESSCPDMVKDSTEYRLLTQSGVEIYSRQKDLEVSIDSVELGKTYMLVFWVKNAAGEVLNSAMPDVIFRDKLAPKIECPDTVVVPCYAENLYEPEITVSTCGSGEDELIVLGETVEEVGCDYDPVHPHVYKIITREYVAKDAAGNYSETCKAVIKVRRLRVKEWEDNVYFPDDTVVSCDLVDDFKDENGSFKPDSTGWPYLVYEYPKGSGNKDTIVLDNSCDNICGLVATYQDLNVNTCTECLEKVLRTWTVMDASCPEKMRMKSGPQTIKVKDTTAPVISWCPDDTVHTTTNLIADFSGYSDVDCGTRYTFPIPKATDNCSDSLFWSVFVTPKDGFPISYINGIEFNKSTPNPADITKDLPYGTNNITYIVADRCGNKDTCEWVLEVEDGTPPVAVCRQFTTVSLTYGGVAIVAAEKFDVGSYDDCGLDSIKVRRMDGAVYCGDDQITTEEFYDDVYFCCADADTYVTVVMRVWDKGGLYNDCMVQVEVKDKIPGQIVECVPSVCVPCEYPFEIDNLSDYFGTVAKSYDARETNVLTYTDTFDTEYFAYYDLINRVCEDDTIETLSFLDGYAFGNCDPKVTETYYDNRTMCNVGDIVRKFYVLDGVNNKADSCTQIIHFYNPRLFDTLHNVDWPNDTIIVGCPDPNADYDPEFTGGYPVYYEGGCDLVGVTYEDVLYTFNDDDLDAAATGVCAKLVRTWTLMDWCQRDPKHEGKYKTWDYDQTILISETNAPEFTTDCVEKEVCTYDAACEEGYIELPMSAKDDCTQGEELRWRYRIDLYNDGIGILGSFDIDSRKKVLKGETISASNTYPIGKHRIVWEVWDQCGNITTCDTYFTVKNCKKPTPICIDHVVVEMMPQDADNNGVADWAMIEVGADLVQKCCQSSYHVCGYDLRYSFTKDTNDVRRTFYCGHDNPEADWIPVCPEVGKLEPDTMWVTALLPDGTITQDFCVTKIDFQANAGGCEDVDCNKDPYLLLSGLITNINDEPIPGVSVELQGSEVAPVNTGNNGTYEFNISENRNYIVAPQKDGEDLAGVTTLDLVLIQKHILDINKINNPYKLLAANVSGDNRLTAADIFILRKLILGKIDDIGNSWMFVNKDYEFENSNVPFNEDVMTSTPVNTNEDAVVNFYGVKMGDINLSLDMLEARSSEKLQLSVDVVQFEAGVVEVPVYAEDINRVEGFQYTFTFDSEVLSFVGVESGALNISEENIGATRAANGLVAMSWNSSNVKSIASDKALFTLKFNAVSNGMLRDVLSLTSDIAKKEAYNSELEVMDVDLQYRGENAGYALYQNTPNPFSDYTEISFTLPKKSECTISIYDLTGKVVKVINNEFEQGRNSVRVNKNDLNVSGVLYYVLETEEFTATKKMIVLK